MDGSFVLKDDTANGAWARETANDGDFTYNITEGKQQAEPKYAKEYHPTLIVDRVGTNCGKY